MALMTVATQPSPSASLTCQVIFVARRDAVLLPCFLFFGLRAMCIQKKVLFRHFGVEESHF